MIETYFLHIILTSYICCWNSACGRGSAAAAGRVCGRVAAELLFMVVVVAFD